jgi:predicted ATPase/DNA-binding CsgD family transcriptional regulator
MRVPRDNLPLQLTPFIGRQAEIEALAACFANADCRLLTVVGPGGIGKTRVAIALIEQLLATGDPQSMPFLDGVRFVSLVAIRSPESLVEAIAEALQCPLSGHADARAQLLGFLRSKQILLVLDNFEHLIDGAELLTLLLGAAPGVKLLVTSRAALHLQEEWRYPLGGFALPPACSAGDEEQSAAVRLLIERARHVRPDFDVLAEREAIARICHLVEGMPLAIELAATWTRSLSCDAIACKIHENIHFLESTVRNLPERHRSIGVLFDHSRARLSTRQSNVFMQLSVFRGSFGCEAAEAVAGASLPLLTALIDQSLLGRREGATPEARFHIHELFRRCAEEYLAQSTAEAICVRDRHCSYYCDFLHQRRAVIDGPGQHEVAAEIAVDLENVRAAWHHALEHGRVAAIDRSAYAFYMFHDIQSRYHEGVELFGRAAQALCRLEPIVQAGPILAEVLVYLGRLLLRLGHLQHARAVRALSHELHCLDVAPRQMEYAGKQDRSHVLHMLDHALAYLPARSSVGAHGSGGAEIVETQVEQLTEREIMVLRLIADGWSNQEIAERLIISLGTTKWYVRQIFGKLAVHSRTRAVMRARYLGVL